jgi:hypothetical protein
MRTDELIRVLVADGAAPVSPIERSLVRALVAGIAISVLIFAIFLRPRPDIATAVQSSAFFFKLAVAVLLAAAAITLLPAAARPLSAARRTWLLALAPVLLLAGVLVELLDKPSGSWTTYLVGHNALHCLSLIPILSLAPAICTLLAMRQGAPARPGIAGALAGLSSGALGAALYALTCRDDSPLFVLAWYSIAIAIVTIGSAIAGSRLLRW